LAKSFFFPLLLCLPLEALAHSLFISAGVQEARIKLDNLELGYTDWKGLFYSEPVAPGFHTLEIEKEGYRALCDTIFVPEGLTYNHTIPLDPLRMIMLNELTGLEADSVGGPYTIQLGAFRSVENARRLADSYRGSRYEPRLESAEVRGVGKVYRVRLALLSSLEEAREAAAPIMRSTGKDLWIVGLDGRDWAVQLGSFNAREHAEKLSSRLDDPTLYVWIEDSPDGIFRVKAGYWADRSAAEQAARKIAASLGVTTMVIQVR